MINYTVEGCTKLLREMLLSSGGRNRFITPYNMRRMGGVIYDLLKEADGFFAKNEFKKSTDISMSVLNVFIPALDYADDSNGTLGNCIGYAFGILEKEAETDMPEEVRKYILEYSFKKYNSGKFEGWDWHQGMLKLALKLIKNKKEFNKLIDLLDSPGKPEYEEESAQFLKYKALIKFGEGNDAEEFLKNNLSNYKLRKEAILAAIQEKDFEKAKKLSLDGIELNRNNKPGLVKVWYDILLQTAIDEDDKIKIIEYSRMLFVDDFLHERDYYAILKEYTEPDKWQDLIEDIITQIIKQRSVLADRQLANIYIREKWFDRLVKLLSKKPDLNTINSYEKYLIPDNSNELIQLYADAIYEYLSDNPARPQYQNACRYFKKMINLGGQLKVNEVIEQLRSIYPNRKALMEELNKIDK